MPIRQILLLPHTHHDVGYTNSPRIIDNMHARTVGRVLDLADEFPDAGAETFRWTFEVARPVLKYLQRATPGDVERLVNHVRRGSIAVTAGYLNMTQLNDIAEYEAAYEALSAVRQQGIAVRTQQHGDVNGLSWGVTDLMLNSGVDRLLMALNPDHGRPPLRQPSGFWWETPSGRRVFVWLSTHYGFGEEWGIVDGDANAAERHMSDFITELNGRNDYPWETAIVHAGNDNRWPTARFLEVVRVWNERHPELPMRTATVDEALDEIQAERHELPVLRGEWADWWAHGHGSTAREVAVYREARTFAHAARATLSLARLAASTAQPAFDVLGYRRGPVRHRTDHEVAETLAHIDEQLLLYGEHTWGSWETYSQPHSTFNHSHHNATSAFAYAAYDHARDLAIEGWFRYVHSHSPVDPTMGAEIGGDIVVINPTATARRELLDVEVAGKRRARVLADVGAFSVAALPSPPIAEAQEVRGAVDAGRYRVLVDPAIGGVRSIIDTVSGREIIDQSSSAGLGAVVDERVQRGSQHPMITTSPKLFHPDHPGPEFDYETARGTGPVTRRYAAGVTEIEWTTTAKGFPAITSTLLIADDSEDIELLVAIDKPVRRAPESVFIAFPFAVAQPTFVLETAGAVFRADTEQLPDTSKDWYSIQHAIGVAADGDAGILWGSFDAPLVQVGGFYTGMWAREHVRTAGHINSWLANNLHFTNFQATQEITRTFRYRFRPATTVTATDVLRWASSIRMPLQARHMAHQPARLPEPPLTVTPADSVVAELSPIAEGVRVRLRNVTERTVHAEVRHASGEVVTAVVPARQSADVNLKLS